MKLSTNESAVMLELDQWKASDGGQSGRRIILALPVSQN